MTVSKITPAQKEMIRVNYTNKRMHITEMAKALEVSTRTIARVLNELDLPTPVSRNKGEKYHAMLEKFRLHVINLPDDAYNSFLTSIIHQREAKKHNVHVQTAMLNLEEKVNRNVRDNKAGRS